jgi:predicted nucleic acid-binding protein
MPVDPAKLPKRVLIDTSALISALTGLPTSPAAEFLNAMVTHSRDVIVASPSLAELLRRGAVSPLPRVRTIQVGAVDEETATILGRDFPPDALKQVRDANGLVLHYYKYDAMILAVGVRYHVDCVVTEDDRQANMAVLAKLTVRKPDYFQASQLQLVP